MAFSTTVSVIDNFEFVCVSENLTYSKSCLKINAAAIFIYKIVIISKMSLSNFNLLLFRTRSL